MSNRHLFMVCSGLGVLALAAAGCDGVEARQSRGTGSGAASIASYAAIGDLPACNLLRRSQVFYVSLEDQYYFCDGSSMVAIALPGALPGSLVALDEAAVSDCPDGGVQISVGSDADEDGALDSGEVTATAVVCHGSPGLAGEDGGSCHVEDNGDGSKTLRCDDGTEVVIEDGEDADDADPLVRVEQELAGSNCTLGGHAVHVGTDANADGELGDDEITSTDYVCNTISVVDGTLVLDEQEEVDALLGVSWITGHLTVSGDLDLSPLATLTRVDNTLVVENNPSLTDLDFLARLSALNGLLVVRNTGIEETEGLGGLENVPGRIELVDNDALLDVDLGGLKSVGSLTVSDNAALESIDLHGLNDGDSLTVGNNDALTTLLVQGFIQTVAITDNDALTNLDGLGSLSSGGSLSITDNDALVDLAGLSGLTSLEQLAIEGNSSLTNLAGLGNLTDVRVFFLTRTALTNLDDLSQLASVTDLFYINQNASLVSLQGMTALEYVGGTLLIHHHPELAPCEISALVSSVSFIGSTSFFDNTGTGTCAP